MRLWICKRHMETFHGYPLHESTILIKITNAKTDGNILLIFTLQLERLSSLEQQLEPVDPRVQGFYTSTKEVVNRLICLIMIYYEPSIF